MQDSRKCLYNVSLLGKLAYYSGYDNQPPGHAMNSLQYLLIGLLFYPLIAVAGITTLLEKNSTGSCRVEISHDATPISSTGVIIIRSYQHQSSVLTPCPATKQQLGQSLAAALKTHADKGLKPIRSVQLGRIYRYDWIKSYLDEQPPVYGMSHRQRHDMLFNTPYFLQDVLEPVQKALIEFKLDIKSSRCEKLLIDKAGKVTDALCWLNIEKLKNK